MPLSFSLQFSPSFTPFSSSSRNFQLSQTWFPLPLSLRRAVSTRVVCISTRPNRKSGAKTDRSEAEELVRGVIRKFSDKEPLLKTLDKYVRVMRTEHCFLLFEELGKKDQWLQCLEVFRWMQKQRWYIADNGVYSKLISIMGKKGQIRMAIWLFSEMRNSGCRPDTSVYNALITAHLHSKDKAKALVKVLWYFEKMKGMERCKPNVVTYNILTRAFAQAGKVDQVNALFKDLDESIVSADIYTYNGVMDAYGKNGMIKEMETMLARMKSNEIKPDIISFNLLIDSYGKKQLFDKMEQVFKSLLRSKERPTLPTFNSMITNYGKARLRERAEEVFRKMKDMGYDPSYVTCESLIMMYGHCDCVSKVPQFPLSRFIDPVYHDWPFWKRLGYQYMAGFTARWKYYFIWSISEASIIISGLGFSGWTKSSPPKPRWDRAKNVDILALEFVKSAVEIPLKWNIQVSTWLRHYVYERLVQKGKKPGFFQLLATQTVSAVWHGLYPGYIIFFVQSAVMIAGSRVIYRWQQAIPPSMAFLKSVLGFFNFAYTVLVLNYSCVGFMVLSLHETLASYGSVYYIGTIIPVTLILLGSIIKPAPARSKARKDK